MHANYRAHQDNYNINIFLQSVITTDLNNEAKNKAKP